LVPEFEVTRIAHYWVFHIADKAHAVAEKIAADFPVAAFAEFEGNQFSENV